MRFHRTVGCIYDDGPIRWELKNSYPLMTSWQHMSQCVDCLASTGSPWGIQRPWARHGEGRCFLLLIPLHNLFLGGPFKKEFLQELKMILVSFRGTAYFWCHQRRYSVWISVPFQTVPILVIFLLKMKTLLPFSAIYSWGHSYSSVSSIHSPIMTRPC